MKLNEKGQIIVENIYRPGTGGDHMKSISFQVWRASSGTGSPAGRSSYVVAVDSASMDSSHPIPEAVPDLSAGSLVYLTSFSYYTNNYVNRTNPEPTPWPKLKMQPDQIVVNATPHYSGSSDDMTNIPFSYNERNIIIGPKQPFRDGVKGLRLNFLIYP